MAGNQTLLVEVDWSSKSGSADSTIAFNETFDISLKGVNNFGADSNVRLVLSTAQTGLEEDNILFLISKTPVIDGDSLLIDNIRVATQGVLDTLNQQGGKGNFYLFVMEERADGSLVDFGSCRIKMTLGGYSEGDVPTENIEGMPTIKELQDSIATINGSLAKAEAAAKRAETAADDLSEDIRDLRQTASDAKTVSAEAKTESAEAKVTATKAESIAKGAQYAKVFTTEAEMKTWAAAEMAKAEDQREVKVGDNLYIEELEVPDYWWTGEGDGYSQLETGAVKIEVDKALSATSTNPVQNKAVKAALDEKANVSSVTGLESALEGKQDRLVMAATSHNLGSVNPDSLADTSTLGNFNSIDLQVGTLAQWGFTGTSARLTKITLFRRGGTTDNGGINMWLRILRWNGSAWFVAYQSSTYVTHNSYTKSGQRIAHTMVHKGGTVFIPTDERVVICYVSSETDDAASLIRFGAKVVASPSGVGMIANARTSVPSDSSFTVAQPYRLAADFEYDVVPDLGEVLEGKADKQHTHSIGSVEGLDEVVPYIAFNPATDGSPASASGARSVVIGQGSKSDIPDGLVLGRDSCAWCSQQTVIGHGVNFSHALYNHLYAHPSARAMNGSILLRGGEASVFFLSDACNSYATTIGFKNSDGCYEERRIEEAFCSSGNSYIMASEAASAYAVPRCSSGIAIGPRACIVADVVNGVAIGVGVEASRCTPVRIGAGCSAITVNSNYELCVGGNPVGGGSSNNVICVDDGGGDFCAGGTGSYYVAIGRDAYAYASAVAVGEWSRAKAGEVAVGPFAGNASDVNGFITENSLLNVRIFRACSDTYGNELFFATKDDKAVLGGGFGRTTDESGNNVASLCYFYLQDVADMLANGGGAVTVDDTLKADSENPIQNKWLGLRMGATENNSVQIGYDAKAGLTVDEAIDGDGGDSGSQVAVGRSANGSSAGVAVGRSANGSSAGVAIGYFATGNSNGVAVGRSANGSSAGVAIGYIANGSDAGASIGDNSEAQYRGVAIGYATSGKNYKVAIGFKAKASDDFPIVIGANTIDVSDYDYSKAVLKVSKEGVMTIGGNEVAMASSIASLEARIAALETQLTATTALLGSNSCVSGAGTIANEDGTEVNYLQNPTGLLDGDELL